ncbi:MAG: sigma-70 family RNA polymerase sigma factor [bacterium]|nr:sigma-70 family RNA polymerase sigma factor [bacterium]
MKIAKTKPESDELSPEELARKAQTGDVAAFEAVVGSFGPRLFRYIRQRVGNLHTAEDLLQETFLKAFGGLGRYDSSRSLATWLFTIATRVTISHGRRKYEVAVPAPNELGASAIKRPDELLTQKEERGNIWEQARSLLPESHFIALWLKYAEDMSVNQMADIMDMSQSNVKVLLHRGRKKLSECIELPDQPRTTKCPRGDNRSNAKSDEVKYVR